MLHGLYHKDVYLPAIDWQLPRLIYSRHAVEQARLRGFALPKQVLYYSVVEAEYYYNRLVKVLIRAPYLRAKEICLVVNVDGYCRTAWLNSRLDNHKTLDRRRYEIH